MKLRVLSSIGIQGALTALASTLEQKIGANIDVSYGTASVFKEKIEAGAEFDVAILTNSVIEDLVVSGHVAPSSVFNIARSGLGLAVRQHAPKPDIGSVQSLKQALLDAESVASSSSGLAGTYFMEVLAGLGITDRMKSKIRLDTSGGYAAEITARGDAQLAVQLVSEILPVRGVDLVGTFPDAIQKYAILSAGISSVTRALSAATALVGYFREPGLEALFASCGLERYP
jgi:molybdate transport system substrate-binding protein